MNKQEWAIALGSFSQAQRQHNSILDRDSLSNEEEWHCRIIGGEFMSWYQRRLSDILAERMVLRAMNFDPKPFIVFTTTMPGLVAAHEIMPEPSEDFICLIHTEYEEWERQHAVDDFTFHIHHWSYFSGLDHVLLTRARETHPSVSVGEFRIHSSGDLWGEQCGVFAGHLWRWNGHEMELLEEAFSQGVY